MASCLSTLRELTDSKALIGEIGHLLGVDSTAGRTLKELAEVVRGREMLLVLDNCEHLVESCGLSLLRRSFSSKGRATVLATSREWLDIYGEHVVHVPPLSTEGPASAAVELFVDRAKAIESSFDCDRGTLISLCEELDGLPLAIELAAARTTVMSVDELREGLSDRFRVLSAGRRRRSHTLEATIDWSYDLLDREAAQAFRHLGAFVGSFSLEAAEGVLALDKHSTVDVVEQLITKSLVQSSGTPGRFQLLETLRAYAVQKLGRGWGSRRGEGPPLPATTLG